MIAISRGIFRRTGRCSKKRHRAAAALQAVAAWPEYSPASPYLSAMMYSASVPSRSAPARAGSRAREPCPRIRAMRRQPCSTKCVLPPAPKFLVVHAGVVCLHAGDQAVDQHVRNTALLECMKSRKLFAALRRRSDHSVHPPRDERLLPGIVRCPRFPPCWRSPHRSRAAAASARLQWQHRRRRSASNRALRGRANMSFPSPCCAQSSPDGSSTPACASSTRSHVCGPMSLCSGGL